jgi:anti-anti-sigma factor
MMSNAHINTAPAEVGAARWGLAGRESAWPQAEAVGPSDFSLALERDDETTVLFLAGELDLYRAPAIKDALAEAIRPTPDSDRYRKSSVGAPAPSAEAAHGLDRGVRDLAVDLRLVTFIDSTTLGLLLEASRRQHAQGGQLLVFVGPHTPMTAFEATGFDRLLAIRRLHDEQQTAPQAP